MIEKLDRHIKTEENGVRISCPPTQADCIDKINELVDFANNLRKELDSKDDEIRAWIDIVCGLREQVKKIDQNLNFAQPEVKENAQDPYAEQRKWIGKMCRFWDGEHIKFCDILGILTKINDMSHRPFEVNNGDKWEYCEPVKPDDDIIYKGE